MRMSSCRSWAPISGDVVTDARGQCQKGEEDEDLQIKLRGSKFACADGPDFTSACSAKAAYHIPGGSQGRPSDLPPARA